MSTGHDNEREPAGAPSPEPAAAARESGSPAPAPAADAAAAYAKAAEGRTADATAADGELAEGDAETTPGAAVAVDAEPDPPAGDGGHQVARDLEELTAKAEKAEEYLSLAQRTKADFENFRKRASREAALAQERGVAKLAKELLPAIDNLDRAVQAAAADGGAQELESQLASGVKLVHADVLAALARLGIEPYSPSGEPFDPNLHEAVAQTPVEGAATGTVVEVYQQGYRLGEAVLRPAKVIVAA